MSIWYALWRPDERISRKTFWLATLILWTAGLAMWVVVLGPIDPKGTVVDDLVKTGERAALITSIILLYPSVAVSINRLHDLGATGWWCVPLFVPGYASAFLSLAEVSEMLEQTAMIASLAVTLVYFITLGFIRGSEKPNRRERDLCGGVWRMAPAPA